MNNAAQPNDRRALELYRRACAWSAGRRLQALLAAAVVSSACSLGQEILRIDIDLLDDSSCVDLSMSSLKSVSIEVVGSDNVGVCRLAFVCTSVDDVVAVEDLEDALADKQQPLIDVPLTGPAEIYVSAYTAIGCPRTDRVLCSQESLSQAVDGVLALRAQCTSSSDPGACDYPDQRPCEPESSGL